jgi:hypothetical protein
MRSYRTEVCAQGHLVCQPHTLVCMGRNVAVGEIGAQALPNNGTSASRVPGWAERIAPH